MIRKEYLWSEKLENKRKDGIIEKGSLLQLCNINVPNAQRAIDKSIVGWFPRKEEKDEN